MNGSIFLQAFIYLAAAVVAVPVARRLGLGSALGYLLAGVLIGPYVLGLVGQEGQDVMHFAEFGVVLMLFLVGLELEPRVLWRMRVPVLGMGGSQVALTALVIGLIAMAFGLDWRTALAIGLTLSLSSTAIVLQTLDEKGWLKTQAGRRGFSVLLFQDVAVIPILALLPFLALPEAGPAVGEALAEHGVPEDRPVWIQTVLVLGVVTGIVLAGRYLTRPLFHWIARTRAHEVFIATALLLVIGITLAMNFVGLSPALGTFLAGVVLAESEYRHELESDIEPFKGLLLGLFFLAVGASIDFALVAGSPLLILALVAILIVVKFGVLLSLGRLFGLQLADNLMFSMMLAQGGEFAFLLFSYATESSVIGRDLTNLLIVVVVLSMMVTPLLIIVYERWLRPLFVGCVAEPEDETQIEEDDNPVIIAGYGRFGQIVSRMLRAGRISCTLLDHDAGQIEFTGRFGNKVFYGDASRRELLEAAGASRAKLLVVAIDNRGKAVEMVRTARQHFPGLKVLARAYDRSHAYRLMEAGAHAVTRETFGSALIMGEEAYKALGYEEAQAYRIMRTFRRHDEEGLEKLYELWGDDQRYGMQIRAHLDELKKVLEDDTAMAEEHFREAWRHMKNATRREP